MATAKKKTISIDIKTEEKLIELSNETNIRQADIIRKALKQIDEMSVEQFIIWYFKKEVE